MFEIANTGTTDARVDLHEQFVEMLCADEDLLRSEFEEIIGAEWPTPPVGQPELGARAEPPPEPRAHRLLAAGPVARPNPPRAGGATPERVSSARGTLPLVPAAPSGRDQPPGGHCYCGSAAWFQADKGGDAAAHLVAGQDPLEFDVQPADAPVLTARRRLLAVTVLVRAHG